MAEIPEISSDVATTSDRAYHTVRRMVVAGEIPPGKWIRRRTLAAQLKMSPTPLADAFRRLEREGLLEHVPLWGVRVKTYTVDELWQLYEMRSAFECIAVRQCASVLTPDHLKHARQLAEAADCEVRERITGKYEQSPDQYDVDDRTRADRHFHLSLARMAGLNVVANEIERLRLLSLTVRHLGELHPLDVSHVAVVDAIESRDAERAQSAIRRHIMQRLSVLPALRARFGDAPIIYDTARDDTKSTSD